MFEIIKEVIIQWDPIGLMGFSPLDEYDDECCLIFNELKKKQEALDKIIYKVFSDNFEEAFQADLVKCTEIATEIERKTGKTD